MKTKFDELLEFPTVLNFKVMGVACDELPDLIIAVKIMFRQRFL